MECVMNLNNEVIPEIWVGVLTNRGLFYPKPLKVYWDQGTESWKDKKGKLEVTKLGLYTRPTFISYSSPERDKVSSWMLGIRCCNQLISNIIDRSKLDLNRRNHLENIEETERESTEKVE